MKLKKCKQCKLSPSWEAIKLAQNYCTLYYFYCPQCRASTDVYWELEQAGKAWNKGKITKT